MGFLARLFGGGGGGSEHNAETVARGIVDCYRRRRANGELRVDDGLYRDLCQVLPDKAAQEVFGRFRTRRSRSDPKAEYLLVMDIGVAIHDAEHYAHNFKPVVLPFGVPDRTRASAANSYAKVVAGHRLTGADEDAVLFDDLLGE